MENYPVLPKTSKGWLSIVMLVLLYGLIYYGWGFPKMWRVFGGMETRYYIHCREDEKQGSSKQENNKKGPVFLVGEARYPFAVSDAAPLPAFFTLYNQYKRDDKARDGDKTEVIIKDLSFWIVSHKKEENQKKIEGIEENHKPSNHKPSDEQRTSTLFLPAFIKENVIRRTITVPFLMPKEGISFREELSGIDSFPFVIKWRARLLLLQDKATEDTDKTKGEQLSGSENKQPIKSRNVQKEMIVEGLCAYVDPETDEEIQTVKKIPYHTLPAVVMSAVEKALLPPWSNVLVITIALVVAALLEPTLDEFRFWTFLWRALAVDVALWIGMFLVVGAIEGWYWPGHHWVGVVSSIVLIFWVVVGVVAWRNKPYSNSGAPIYKKVIRGCLGSAVCATIMGGTGAVLLVAWELKVVAWEGKDPLGPTVAIVGIGVIMALILWTVLILWQWRWDKELSLQREEIEWEERARGNKEVNAQKEGKSFKHYLSFPTWFTSWQRHLGSLEKKIKGIERNEDKEEKGEKEERSLSKWFWHQERGPHEDALAIATWLYPGVVGLHCQWLAEKYTRQQRDTVVSFPKWLHSVKRKLSRRQESQSSEEASPWKKFLDNLEAWGKGLKEVRKAASLPEGEMPPSWPQQSEFQQLWHQLMKWGDGSFSVNDARYDIRRLQKFCSPRFLAFYDFAVRQREKCQNEQKKQEQEKEISKPESDGK